MGGIGSRVKARRVEIGMSQGALAAAASEGTRSLSYQSVQAIEKGGETKHLNALARALGVHSEWLEKGTGPKELVGHDQKPIAAFQPAPAPLGFIEVRGMAECGPDGWSLWNGDVVDRVPRPPNLAGATNAYAVFVVGSSMEPRYHPGELVYIHPGKPVTPGAYVLVQIEPKEDGGAPRAVIKRLVRRTGSKIILEQFSPAKTFDLKADEIRSMHRVVGSGEA